MWFVLLWKHIVKWQIAHFQIKIQAQTKHNTTNIRNNHDKLLNEFYVCFCKFAMKTHLIKIKCTTLTPESFRRGEKNWWELKANENQIFRSRMHVHPGWNQLHSFWAHFKFWSKITNEGISPDIGKQKKDEEMPHQISLCKVCCFGNTESKHLTK